MEGCNAGLVLERLVEDGLVLEAAFAGIGFKIAELDGNEFVCFEISCYKDRISNLTVDKKAGVI